MLRYLIVLSFAVFSCFWTAIFYRPLNTHVNNLLVATFGEDFLSLRTTIQANFPLSDTLIYNVPGAMWIFGLSLLGWRLYLGTGVVKIHLFYVALFIGQFFELIQAFQLTDGTFDWYDLGWNFIGFFAALAFCRLMPDHWRAGKGHWRYILFFVVFVAAFGVDVLS